MLDWLRDNLPEGYADAILWVALALLLFFILLVVVRTLRRFRGGTFILGGRNRRTRLAVMDATPVDSRRRLVLVRRDDVEHLILIGGPTDVVVEQDIRVIPRAVRAPDSAASDSHSQTAEKEVVRQPTRQPPPQPVPVRHVEPPRPAAAPPPANAASPSHTRLPPAAIPMSPPPAPPVAKPVAHQQSAPASQATVDSRPHTLPVAKQSKDEIDLLDDIELTLDDAPAPLKGSKPTADEEMTRLLGELSQRK